MQLSAIVLSDLDIEEKAHQHTGHGNTSLHYDNHSHNNEDDCGNQEDAHYKKVKQKNLLLAFWLLFISIKLLRIT